MKTRKWFGMRYVANNQAVWLQWPHGWVLIFMWN